MGRDDTNRYLSALEQMMQHATPFSIRHLRCSHRRAALAGATCAAIGALLGGCTQGRAGEPLPSEGARASWRWRAVRMEVSALTTPIPAAGERRPAVDVRISFFDSDGDETKAVGLLTLRVTQGDTALATQVVDLSAKTPHARAWDGVTETYAILMELPAEPAVGRQIVVSASFESADGERMSGTRDLRWPELRR